MILIYANNTSSRLQYICQFIFTEQLGITFSLTTDLNGFKAHDGRKINYSHAEDNAAFQLPNHELLFENNIREQHPEVFVTNNFPAFFKISNANFDFDILAASFYLLSRYEEYLPYKMDMYGRFAHENSFAFKQGFLETPLVNIWIKKFAESLSAFFPSLQFKFPLFKFIPSYDIDIAYSFKHKGMLRNLGGFIKSPSFERLAVLMRLSKDPFDTYDFMDSIHDGEKINPIYFFLVATSGSMYDKNISPYSRAMWQLIKRHAKKYTIGLHPSWRSNKNIVILKKEKKILETAGSTTITRSRQHYIKFSLPETYESLIESGIRHDYSMGYGSVNGFRASAASPFYWYNLKKETITPLQIFPFCFMDANSFYEQHLSPSEAYKEISYYYDICKQVNGLFITVFHNNFLGADVQFKGWKEMYVKFISRFQQ